MKESRWQILLKFQVGERRENPSDCVEMELADEMGNTKKMGRWREELQPNSKAGLSACDRNRSWRTTMNCEHAPISILAVVLCTPLHESSQASSACGCK